MSEHRARVLWECGGRAFTYDQYSREHRITYGGGVTLTASGAAEYRGDAGLPNPEEQLVAALSTCHMLTLLAICARRGIVVEKYEDDALGHLAKNDQGRLAVTTCELRPKITFGAGVSLDASALDKLHRESHLGCFIAASVKTQVTVHPA